MSCHFELFGWCWEPEFLIKTFWIGAWVTPETKGDFVPALLMVGMYEDKFLLRVFGITITGRK